MSADGRRTPPRNAGNRRSPIARAKQAVAPVAERALPALRSTASAALDALGNASGRLRTMRNRRADGPGRRPDGSLVSRSPQARAAAAAPQGDKLTSGARHLGAVLRSRWNVAIAEGKLAAREKESEVRAEYERKVRHDPRLHARQLGRKPSDGAKK